VIISGTEHNLSIIAGSELKVRYTSTFTRTFELICNVCIDIEENTSRQADKGVEMYVVPHSNSLPLKPQNCPLDKSGIF
jgi:hypothetical protein